MRGKKEGRAGANGWSVSEACDKKKGEREKKERKKGYLKTESIKER
jgi:hypothetical protein